MDCKSTKKVYTALILPFAFEMTSPKPKTLEEEQLEKTEKSRNNDERVNSKTYIKKGFWIFLGIFSGLVTLVGGVGLILLAILFLSKEKDSIGKTALNIVDFATLNKEQKQFKSCYEKKEIQYKDYWLWKGREKYIPYYISYLCEKEGYKVSGRFLKQYKSIEKDICKEMGEC